MCLDFFLGMLLGWQPLLAQCIDLEVFLYYATVQNLVYRCGHVPQITAESIDTPLIQQFVDMSIQLLVGLQCDPVQMAEVVQQEYALVSVAWLYSRVNVVNTIHLSITTVTVAS